MLFLSELKFWNSYKKLIVNLLVVITLVILPGCQTSFVKLKLNLEEKVQAITVESNKKSSSIATPAKAFFGTLFKSDESEEKKQKLSKIVAKVETEAVPQFEPFSSLNAAANVKKAIDFHPSVISSVKALEVAKSQVAIAQSSQKFSSNAKLSGGLISEDSDTDAAAVVNLSATKLLYDSGSSDFAIFAAQKNVSVAEKNVISKSNQVAVEAYSAWLNLIKTQEISDIFRRGIKLAEPLLGQIKDVSVSGLADKRSLLLAKKNYSELTLNYEASVVSKRLAESKFLEIFQNADLNSVEKLELFVTPIVDDDLENLIINTNSVKADLLSMEATQAIIKSYEFSQKPLVAANAKVTAPAQNLKTDGFANVGVVVSYTFNDGGKVQARIEGELAKLSSMSSALNLKKREMKSQYFELKSKYDQSSNQLVETKNLIELALDIRQSAKAQLVSGQSTISDILSAEIELAELHIRKLQAEVNSSLASIRIKALLFGMHTGKY